VGTTLLWFQDNWFSLLQTIGIIGSLVFTGVSLRQETHSRRASDLLTLTEHHRDLWQEVYCRPGLGRIYAEEVDLISSPVTVAEERFLNEVIVHFHTAWQLVSQGSLLSLETMRVDARTFFMLPIPQAVWKQTKANRDSKFVHFIEKCLQDTKS